MLNPAPTTADPVLADGQTLRLGEVLGEGGEGRVHALPDHPQLAVKLYRSTPSLRRVAKLEAMIAAGSDRLRRFAAWPQALVYPAHGATAMGFLMPRLHGYRPLHDLYNPSSRRLHFPQADWSYLLHVARNLAAAFTAVHRRHCVIGDVNEGTAWVDPLSGRVSLLDCDSFQLAQGDELFFCEVGAPHFTPPELHRISSFRSAARSPAHDAFGLAVLIFHLLFLGRHPYSGIPPDDEELPLERAISRNLFVYGGGAHGLRPPPGAQALSCVGAELTALFERAFCDDPQNRPSPADWVQQLDRIGLMLQDCPRDAMHRFLETLTECPWCALQAQTGLRLFGDVAGEPTPPGSADQQQAAADPPAPPHGSAPAFELDPVWRAISQIPSPGTEPAPLPRSKGLRGRPVPSTERWLAVFANLVRVGSLGGLAIAVYAAPHASLLWAALAGLCWYAVAGTAHERSARRQRLRQAQQHYDTLRARWAAVAGDQAFARALAALAEDRRAYLRLPASRQALLERQRAEALQMQMQRHLMSHGVPRDGRHGVDASLRASLLSFGIGSAADIDEAKLAGVPHLQPALRRGLLDWRHELARSFKPNVDEQLDAACIAAVDLQLAQQRIPLERRLGAGATVLMQLSDQLRGVRQAQRPALQAAAAALAQAQADVRACSWRQTD